MFGYLMIIVAIKCLKYTGQIKGGPLAILGGGEGKFSLRALSTFFTV